MGRTLEDTHRLHYWKLRNSGKDHEGAMDAVPEELRDKFESDLDKTILESHFGLTPRGVWVLTIAMAITAILIGIKILWN